MTPDFWRCPYCGNVVPNNGPPLACCREYAHGEPVKECHVCGGWGIVFRSDGVTFGSCDGCEGSGYVKVEETR